ncbi:MAG: acyl carrier protein, partial [Actinomycetota bacterium]|nr:acyl carrier protein [Actinomycetota bacterium]
MDTLGASRDGWAGIAAEVLGCDVREIESAAGRRGFVTLGGTSIRAIEFAARLSAELGLGVEVSRLLADTPLADVLASATPCVARTPSAPTIPARGGPVLA